MPDQQNTPRRTAPAGSFALEVGVAMGVFTTLVFIGMFWRNVAVMRGAAGEQASSYIDLIVNARTWNAVHGGVWVVKGPTSPTNPYLRELGVEPDTSTASGTELTLRNPAAMTRELSTIANDVGHVSFKITSLQLINPDNAPDAWERQKLRGFSADRRQVSQVENGASGHVLRMIRPLLVEESCLQCHGEQGYRVGDVRGAISVTVPLAATDQSIATSGVVLFVIYLLVMVCGGALGYWLIARMARRIDRSERALHVLATTDPLTGIPNRRFVLQRLDEELARAARHEFSVGVLELDIDRFKDVNDTYGHAAGDEVLRGVSSCIVDALREYDAAGRLGGEEFLIVAPEVDEASLLTLAERLRADIEQLTVTYGESEIRVTASLGAALSHAGNAGEDLLCRADTAMYAAKTAGRNRVETAS